MPNPDTDPSLRTILSEEPLSDPNQSVSLKLTIDHPEMDTLTPNQRDALKGISVHFARTLRILVENRHLIDLSGKEDFDGALQHLLVSQIASETIMQSLANEGHRRQQAGVGKMKRGRGRFKII